MISRTISDTKNRFSELIASVRKGETLIVTDRKRPVARIEPIQTLGDHPHLSPSEKAWNPTEFLDLPLPEALEPEQSLSKAVLEERESGW